MWLFRYKLFYQNLQSLQKHFPQGIPKEITPTVIPFSLLCGILCHCVQFAIHNACHCVQLAIRNALSLRALRRGNLAINIALFSNRIATLRLRYVRNDMKKEPRKALFYFTENFKFTASPSRQNIPLRLQARTHSNLHLVISHSIFQPYH